MSQFEIIDDFLPAEIFELLRKHCDTISYNGVVNPADGVVYPGISVDIPPVVLQFFGNPKFIFMRLSLAGVPVPHQAHTDSLMGRRSAMFYLNRHKHCQGGTSLVWHCETQMSRDPQNEHELNCWTRDTNNPKAWKVYELAEMRPNRLVMFDAGLMHRAEPVGGFGSSAYDGRLVLTAFY